MTNSDRASEAHATAVVDRLARMEWTQEGERIFTLIADTYRCKVWWVEVGDTWAAMVSQGGMARASYSFTTCAKAQAWCEQELPTAHQR
jgi:hypothetical protein